MAMTKPVDGITELKAKLEELYEEAQEASREYFFEFTMGSLESSFKVNLSTLSAYFWYMNSLGRPAPDNVKNVISHFLLEKYKIDNLDKCYRDIGREHLFNENPDFLSNPGVAKMNVLVRPYGFDERHNILQKSTKKEWHPAQSDQSKTTSTWQATVPDKAKPRSWLAAIGVFGSRANKSKEKPTVEAENKSSHKISK